MIRRTLTTFLGMLMLAGAVAPLALADPTPGFPPSQGARFDGRSPDTKDAAYAAHHSNARNYGVAVGYASPPDGIAFDGRSPDTKDAAYAAHHPASRNSNASVGSGSVPDGTGLDGRSPDTKDAAAFAHTSNGQTPVTGSSGFAWDDAGVGAVAALGVIAILGFGTTRLRNRRPTRATVSSR